MTYSGNYFLSLEEMTVNAQYIHDYLLPLGWTKESVSGMLGNMQVESTINPGIWQNLDAGNMSMGYGLVQWTPASKYWNWCANVALEPSEMNSNLSRILQEVEIDTTSPGHADDQWISTDEYPLSFLEFTQSKESPENLASAFLRNYERAGVEVEEERRQNARYWYDILEGDGGGGVDPPPPKNNLIPFIVLNACGVLNNF